MTPISHNDKLPLISSNNEEEATLTNNTEAKPVDPNSEQNTTARNSELDPKILSEDQKRQKEILAIHVNDRGEIVSNNPNNFSGDTFNNFRILIARFAQMSDEEIRSFDLNMHLHVDKDFDPTFFSFFATCFYVDPIATTKIFSNITKEQIQSINLDENTITGCYNLKSIQAQLPEIAYNFSSQTANKIFMNLTKQQFHCLNPNDKAPAPYEWRTLFLLSALLAERGHTQFLVSLILNLSDEQLAKVDLNTKIPVGPDKGKTLLWIITRIANNLSNEIITLSLEGIILSRAMVQKRDLDLNAAPESGPDKGKTVKEMLKTFPLLYFHAVNDSSFDDAHVLLQDLETLHSNFRKASIGLKYALLRYYVHFLTHSDPKADGKKSSAETLICYIENKNEKDKKLFDLILNNPRNDIHNINYYGWTPLMSAIVMKDQPMVERIMSIPFDKQNPLILEALMLTRLLNNKDAAQIIFSKLEFYGKANLQTLLFQTVAPSPVIPFSIEWSDKFLNNNEQLKNLTVDDVEKIIKLLVLSHVRENCLAFFTKQQLKNICTNSTERNQMIQLFGKIEFSTKTVQQLLNQFARSIARDELHFHVKYNKNHYSIETTSQNSLKLEANGSMTFQEFCDFISSTYESLSKAAAENKKKIEEEKKAIAEQGTTFIGQNYLDHSSSSTESSSTKIYRSPKSSKPTSSSSSFSNDKPQKPKKNHSKTQQKSNKTRPPAAKNNPSNEKVSPDQYVPPTMPANSYFPYINVGVHEKEYNVSDSPIKKIEPKTNNDLEFKLNLLKQIHVFSTSEKFIQSNNFSIIDLARFDIICKIDRDYKHKKDVFELDSNMIHGSHQGLPHFSLFTETCYLGENFNIEFLPMFASKQRYYQIAKEAHEAGCDPHQRLEVIKNLMGSLQDLLKFYEQPECKLVAKHAISACFIIIGEQYVRLLKEDKGMLVPGKWRERCKTYKDYRDHRHGSDSVWKEVEYEDSEGKQKGLINDNSDWDTMLPDLIEKIP